MPQTLQQIDSNVIELSTASLEAFCDDIAGMFGLELSCRQGEPITGTVAELSKNFRKLVAINSVTAEGKLDGVFHIVLDHNGAFIISGTIVMLPENRIRENCKIGAVDQAGDMGDAIGETGNLMIGAWDRIFRDGLEGHKHFTQTNVFIGKWADTEKELFLSPEANVVWVQYEFTLGSFDPFTCMVVFPAEMFNPNTEESEDEQPQADVEESSSTPAEEPKQQEQKPTKQDEKAEVQDKAEKQQQTKEDSQKAQPTQPKAEKQNDKTAPSQQKAAENNDKAVEKKKADKQDAVKAAGKSINVKKADRTISGKQGQQHPDESVQPQNTDTPFNEPVRKPQELEPDLHSKLTELFSMPVEQIMKTDVLWCSPDDTVADVQAAMQRHCCDYALIGGKGIIEGIISYWDIKAAISIYLRPIFMQWRGPTDDATLRIRVKWLLNRPVHTVRAVTPAGAIFRDIAMGVYGAVPVLNESEKVVGIITQRQLWLSVIEQCVSTQKQANLSEDR